MRAFIYLKEEKPENLLADVNVEVCPRGIYEINGAPYQLTGQPKFVIQKGGPYESGSLHHVTLVVQHYSDSDLV